MFRISSCIRCIAQRRSLLTNPTKYNIPSNLFQPFSSQSDKDKKEETAWIPPQRPLSGDKGNYYDDEVKKEALNLSEETEYYDLSNIKYADMNNEKLNTPSSMGDIIETEDESGLTDEEVRKLIEEFERGQHDSQGWNEVDDEDDDDESFGGIKEGEEYEVEDDNDDLEEYNDDDSWVPDDDVQELDEDKLKLIAEKVDEKMSKDDEDYEPIEIDIPDWMVTRRKKIAKERVKLPEVRLHTLLSSYEIMTCLNSLGGINTVLIAPTPQLHVEGMIITTGTTLAHNRHLSETLVQILRDRKLQECDVVGAMHGAEGGEENVNDDWIVVDCGSYAVHIMDDFTRRNLKLEELWNPNNKERTNLSEDEFDEKHPIPEEYLQKLLLNGENSQGGVGDGLKSKNDTMSTMDTLKKTKWRRERSKEKKNQFRRK